MPGTGNWTGHCRPSQKLDQEQNLGDTISKRRASLRCAAKMVCELQIDVVVCLLCTDIVLQRRKGKTDRQTKSEFGQHLPCTYGIASSTPVRLRPAKNNQIILRLRSSYTLCHKTNWNISSIAMNDTYRMSGWLNPKFSAPLQSIHSEP